MSFQELWGGGFCLLNNLDTNTPDIVKPAASGEVTYDLNGGDWSSDYTSTHQWKKRGLNSYTITLPECNEVTAPAGCCFTAWLCKSSGNSSYFTSETLYAPGYQSISCFTDGPGVYPSYSFTFSANYGPSSYQVAFNNNGGSGSMSNQSFTYNTGQNLKANTFTKTCYHFAGWATSQAGAINGVIEYLGGAYVNNLSPTHGAVVTLYAVWEANTYYVSYNPNGARGIMVNQTFQYDQQQNLTSNNFTNSDKYFMGWATSQVNANNHLVAYQDGELVSNLTQTNGGTFNLFAVWRERIYYVEFNGSGGTGSMSTQEFESGTFQNLSTNNFSKVGHKFLGWALSAGFANNKMVNYADGESVINLTDIDSATVTLHAVWEGIDYYVIYNGFGGQGSVANQMMKYGKSMPLNSNAYTKEGYKFIGWASSELNAQNGVVDYLETEVVSNLTTVEGGIVNLYAVWEEVVVEEVQEAYYDHLGGFWYIEMGAMPQTRVTAWLNAVLNSSALRTSGNQYKVANDIVLDSYLYKGDEYCVYNNQWYHVEPIRWRLSEDYTIGQNIYSDNAIMASIVYADAYSTGTTDYSTDSVQNFYFNLQNNKIFNDNLINFTPSDLGERSDKMYVASESEVQAITGDYSVKFSDLISDIIGTKYYYVRTPGTDGNVKVYGFMGTPSQRTPTTRSGIQFSIKVVDFVCVENK